MPSTFSPEFLERIRQPPPPPFVNWRPWQRRLFAWGAALAWIVLLGAAGILLTGIWQLPTCGDSRSGFFNSDCHTTVGIGVCLSALLILWLLYLKFLVLVSQIAYIPTNAYGDD
jgi:hypothetical protein